MEDIALQERGRERDEPIGLFYFLDRPAKTAAVIVRVYAIPIMMKFRRPCNKKIIVAKFLRFPASASGQTCPNRSNSK